MPRHTCAIVVIVCLLAGGLGRQAAAQSSANPSCTIGGTVRSGVTPLPGVAVSVSRADHVIASTSTDDEGRWQVVVSTGSFRIGYELRGFIPVEQAPTGDTGCTAPFSTSLEVDRNPGVRIAARPATTQPAASGAAEQAPPPMIIRGRDATLNRAMLRERDAALARGEFTLSGDGWPQGLITGGPGANTASAGLALAGRAGVRGAVVTPQVLAQRAPRPPTIGAERLYSATASYTVAGSALDSAPYQLRADTRQPKPDYLRQSVDFTIGGPLTIPGAFTSSRKTTATLSYSAIRGGNLFDQYATVPTAAMREGDFSSLPSAVRDPLTGLPFEGGILPAERISPAAQSLLAFLPLPNGSGTNRNYHYTSTNRSTQDTMNLRLAHALVGDTQPARGSRGNRATQAASGISATLNGQVEYRRNINDRLNPLPAIAGLGSTSNLRVPVSLNVNRRGTQQTASIAYTRSTNDTTNSYADRLNVAGHAGIAGASSDPFTWGIPSLSFATVTSAADLTPSTRTDQRLTAGYSWSRGVRTHRIRVGGDIGASRSATRTDQNARGAFVFTGLYSGSDVADFLLGRPQQASVQYGPGMVHLAGRTLSLYAQDDWRRSSNLTINAGLRYELVTPLREQSGRLTNLDVAPGFSAVAPVTSGGIGDWSGPFPEALVRTDTNNLAPRIGAAWRVAAKTTIRLGYGVSFNTGSYSSFARQLAGQPPFAVTNMAIGSAAEPLSLTTALTGGTGSTTNTYGVARDYEAGSVATWTLDLGRDIGDAWNVSGGITRATGSNLDIIRAPNRGPDGLRLEDAQAFLWQTSEGRSRLRSATLRLRRWYVRGIGTSVEYTFARSMDNASTIGGGATVVAQDERNLAAEWGPSSFNRGHRLSGELNFELPFGRDHRWLNQGGLWAALLDKWSVYVTFSAQSGTPLTARILSSTADVARGTNGTLRADVTGAPISEAQPTVDRFFNTEAFALPQAGAFGNSGRNLITGPGSRDLSLQITREVPVGARTLSLQFRAQNVLNLVNYASVDTVVNSPTFGQVLSVRPMRSMQINLRWKM